MIAVRLVGGLTAGAGVIHSVALVQHFDEGIVYGAFFAVVAVGQLAWGTVLYRRPHTRRTLAVGAIANLAVAAIWLVSRTTGLPLGPEAGQPETLGLSDLVATFNEMAMVALVVAIRQPTGRLGTRVAGLTAEQQTRIGSALISVTALGILFGTQTH